LLAVIFTGWRKSGKLDLEGVEMATRAAMHRAGTVVLGQLLSCSETVPLQGHVRVAIRPSITISVPSNCSPRSAR
jgi:hypothetical protein